MKRALAIMMAGWIATAALSGNTSVDRFSQSLTPAERTAGGLTRLSSDEIAVIDALVRRDTSQRVTSAAGEKTPATFTQRLSVSERTAAGLAKLTNEVPQLDALIDRFQNAKIARTLLAPPRYLSRRDPIPTSDTKKEREIHGSFSLSYGFGSGGYSEKTGSMVLNFEDPARRYSITVGYTESHIKGGSIYRDPFYRDPFYDPTGPQLEPAPLRGP